jgi:hypothetical protein
MMHQLILGSDISARDRILRDLKARFFKTPDALKFDLAGLDAQGLELDVLKAAVMTLPAVAERRILIISRADKLNDQNLEFIDKVLDQKDPGCILVLEAAGWDRRNALRKRIAERLKVSGGGEERKSVFDLFNDLARDRAGVLLRMKDLLEDDAVENVLGAMRWWWANKVKGTIPAPRYKKGLLMIQEADERIKLSGLLSREESVEVLLVKLSSLLRA